MSKQQLFGHLQFVLLITVAFAFVVCNKQCSKKKRTTFEQIARFNLWCTATTHGHNNCPNWKQRQQSSSFVDSMAQFTLYNKHNAPPNNDILTRVDCDCEHVPLCSINDVQLRFLVPDDLTEVRTLCQEWFPIDYPLSWYEDITSSTRFFALAAVYNLAIIGLIVAEIKPYRYVNKEDKGILPDSMGRTADVGYILSLGVHRSHRRNGIGSLLLDALMNHLTTIERHAVKAIFLHTLTTNQPAIFFYEKRRFTLHSFLPYYYNIRGKGKDGFTYVTYINGGHPPWTLLDHFKHYASKLRHTGSLCVWMASRVQHVVRWFYHKLLTRFNVIE
ncbi:N-alpha-acetyltransferase 60 [Drosophila nasuta]|uniref:N-alpha-acetyltransferase 60 n=1 Tax=Drosophila nasuta TaxID=42062 RepID=UPI001470F82E|nr:N-alpha-acetyltransferase 60 [Drosophila nasuta]